MFWYPLPISFLDTLATLRQGRKNYHKAAKPPPSAQSTKTSQDISESEQGSLTTAQKITTARVAKRDSALPATPKQLAVHYGRSQPSSSASPGSSRPATRVTSAKSSMEMRRDSEARAFDGIRRVG